MVLDDNAKCNKQMSTLMWTEDCISEQMGETG